MEEQVNKIIKKIKRLEDAAKRISYYASEITKTYGEIQEYTEQGDKGVKEQARVISVDFQANDK